jgi:hypothetical protein
MAQQLGASSARDQGGGPSSRSPPPWTQVQESSTPSPCTVPSRHVTVTAGTRPAHRERATKGTAERSRWDCRGSGAGQPSFSAPVIVRRAAHAPSMTHQGIVLIPKLSAGAAIECAESAAVVLFSVFPSAAPVTCYAFRRREAFPGSHRPGRRAPKGQRSHVERKRVSRLTTGRKK